MGEEKIEEHKEEHHHIEHHKEHHTHKLSIHKHISLYNIFIGLAIVLAIVLVINIIVTFNISKDISKNIEETKEKLRPAKIELTLLKNSKCKDCYDITAVVSSIKGLDVNVTKEKTVEFDSKEGKEIVKKYGIGKIPAVVVTGEIEKVNIEGLEKNEDALLFAQVQPPYTNVANEKIEGRVSLFFLKDSQCNKCNNLSALVRQIKSAEILISEEKSIEYSSEEGKELIKRYNIGFVPTLILSKDAALYDIIQRAWFQIGSKEDDGSYVLRLVYPPFINLTTGQLRGLVDVTYLTDKSCAECYDVNLHKQILANPQSFGMELEKEEFVDISDTKSKDLVAKYNITQVPTVIISAEVSVYPSSRALSQFFSAEKDGSYVFRKLSALGAYKDLATNKVVQAQQESE